jgi:hypothetical protein
MTSAPTTPHTAPSATLGEVRREPLRLRMKPKASAATGWVDGGWWPRSRDLAVELPGLLAVLAVRLGRIERVSYHLPEWAPTVRKISYDGGVVRLGRVPDAARGHAGRARGRAAGHAARGAPGSVSAGRAYCADGRWAPRQYRRRRDLAPVPYARPADPRQRRRGGRDGATAPGNPTAVGLPRRLPSSARAVTAAPWPAAAVPIEDHDVALSRDCRSTAPMSVDRCPRGWRAGLRDRRRGTAGWGRGE